MDPLPAPRAPTFRLRYLPVNACWAFVFGDTPIRLDYVGQTLFPSYSDAIAAAALCGLYVTRDGHVNAVRRTAA